MGLNVMKGSSCSVLTATGRDSEALAESGFGSTVNWLAIEF